MLRDLSARGQLGQSDDKSYYLTTRHGIVGQSYGT